MKTRSIDWKMAGSRIALLRQRKGYSVRALAMAASVDKNTVLRIERGLPLRLDSFQRICSALQTTPGRQLLEIGQPEERYRVARDEGRKWLKARMRTSTDPFGEEALFADRVKRWKYGWSGTEPTFNGLLDCELYDGSLMASTAEIFAKAPSQRHPGEEFIYCLRGRVFVYVDGDEIELGEGDAISFWSNCDHCIAPVKRPSPGEVPPLILSVRLESGTGSQSPMSMNSAQRYTHVSPRKPGRTSV